MNRLGILLVTLAFLLTICYTYNKGLHDGEQRYKHSYRIYMALKSAYNFGWLDGHNGKPMDWDNGGE